MTTRTIGPRDERLAAAAPGAAAQGMADWLCLAATPTFAAMALLAARGGAHDMLCAAMPDASPLTGMAWMYLVMSAFHLAPWLRLISARRGAAGRP